MIMFGSFLPSLLVGQCHQLYSGLGADIVMESSPVTGLAGIAYLVEHAFRRAFLVLFSSCALAPEVTASITSAAEAVLVSGLQLHR